MEPKLAAIQEEIDDLNPRSAAKTVKLSSDNWGLLEKNLLKHARFMDLEKFLTGIFTLITSNEIKKSEDKKDIPVLMTSSRNDIKDVKLALKEGVFDYMIKPVDP